MLFCYQALLNVEQRHLEIYNGSKHGQNCKTSVRLKKKWKHVLGQNKN